MEKEYESENTAAYKCVISDIIEQVGRSTKPYENAWRDAEGTPWNAVSKRLYSGINMLILWSVAIDRGFDCHRWLTERQAAAKSGRLREGERGTTIFFGTRRYDADGQSRGLYRQFTVANWLQFDGLPPLRVEPLAPKLQAVSQFYALVAASGAEIRYGGNKAQYNVQDDVITLPNPWDFYFPTNDLPRALAHELGHWCLHPSRLNLQIVGEHALMRRAYEEILVELAAAFVCWHFQINPSVRSADYIAEWLFGTAEKYGHRPSAAEAILRVSQDAMRVSDHILSFDPGP